jgi:RNA polymerase sigma-70 factor (ECF subfamily)
MPLSEADLLGRARQADSEALGEIFDLYNPRLYGYAYRLTGEDAVARDIASETFYRFLLALRGGGGPHDHLAAYLYRVAYHLVIDRHRRQPYADLSLDESLTADHAGMDENAMNTESQSLARNALWQLTDEQRQVIVLKYFEELTNEEVAVALNKPVGAVKSLQARALAALRRILSQEGEGVLP